MQEAETPTAATCPICGETFPADLDECSRCHQETALAVHLRAVASSNRFLFGRVKQLPQIETLIPAEKKARKKTPAKPKSKPRTASNLPGKPRLSAGDLIHDRDPEIRSPNLKSGTPRTRLALIYLIDVLLCMTLNLIVLKSILWLSGRTLTPLVSFSLIPLFFVLLCFTVLYFWLFLSLFKKSLGRIVIDRMFEQTQSGGDE